MKRTLFIFQFLAISTLCAGPLPLKNYELDLPCGWTAHQIVHDSNSTLVALSNGIDEMNFVVRRGGSHAIQSYLAQGVYPIGGLMQASANGLDWTRVLVSRKNGTPFFVGARFSAVAVATDGTYTYLAHVRSSDRERALLLSDDILTRIRPGCRSLTSEKSTAKKFYVGFGEILGGVAGNEVKYDIAHTHKIFTDIAGGKYQGKTFLGESPINLKREWDTLRAKIDRDDMYLQYSSGHGSDTGLGFGVTYDEIRDNALSFGAKEVVIFTMACHSGGLIDSFRRKEKSWKDLKDQGRTLFVMSSSGTDEASCLGPGHDPEEPGPEGSAGSAFGHSLWKALRGYADGTVDGVVDGYLTLAEIRDYTYLRTKVMGGHSPVVAGSYFENLFMTAIPK